MSEIRILSIDDEPALTRSIQSYLEDYDYIVDTANNGEEGLRMFRETKYDVVITDLMMPGISGHDVIKTINKVSPETPTIVASGAGRVSDALTAINQGAWDYLTKPIKDLEELRITVERVLEKSRLIKENKRYQNHLEELVREKTAELEKTVEELFTSRENMRLTLNSIGDMVVVLDMNSRITRINPKVCNKAEMTEAEIVGKQFNEMFVFKNFAISEEYSDPEKGTYEISEQIMRFAHSEEDYIIVGTVSPISPRNCDSITGLVVVLNDITESRQLQRQLQQAQKMDAIGRLASGISHDFRNVLTGIMGMSEVILNEVENEQLKDLVRAILSSAETSNALITKLLSFSRESEIKMSPVNLNHVIEDTKTILRHTLSQSITIEDDLTEDVPCIYGNQPEIQNSLINMAINANDAMNGTGKLSFSTEVEYLDKSRSAHMTPPVEVGEYIKLSISDTGSGIPDDLIQSVFEPFFTTKPEGKGTGLGLASVYGMVASHKGSIGIKSVIDKGTTFEIYLPRYYDSEANAQVVEMHSLDGVNIIAVDDEYPMRLIMSSLLAKCGANVVSFENGQECIDYYNENFDDIDIVIVDLYLRDMDGWQCINGLKKVNEEVKVVLCSGADLSNLPLEEHSIVGLIRKPFKSEDVVEELYQCLGGDK